MSEFTLDQVRDYHDYLDSELPVRCDMLDYPTAGMRTLAGLPGRLYAGRRHVRLGTLPDARQCHCGSGC